MLFACLAIIRGINIQQLAAGPPLAIVFRMQVVHHLQIELSGTSALLCCKYSGEQRAVW